MALSLFSFFLFSFAKFPIDFSLLFLSFFPFFVFKRKKEEKGERDKETKTRYDAGQKMGKKERRKMIRKGKTRTEKDRTTRHVSRPGSTARN